MRIKNIFITGPIHIGKSTIINRVIDRLPDLRIGGFRTLPIYKDNKRGGFIFNSLLNGTGKIFAHVDLKSNDRYDIYNFNYRVFEEVGVSTLQTALLESDVILMDEIGVMEEQAEKFRQMIVKCCDSPCFVFGAFQERATWFLKMLKERVDTKIFVIDNDNRNSIFNQIISLINENLLSN